MRTDPRWRDEAGQSMIMVALALPVLLLVASLLIDVGGLFLDKRSLQNRADAAALAAVPMLASDGTCNTQCEIVLNQYSHDPDDHTAPHIGRCGNPKDWNCYIDQYKGGQAVDVRLRDPDRPLHFARAATLGALSKANVDVTSVAGLTINQTITQDPDQIVTTTGPDQTFTNTTPAQTVTTTTPATPPSGGQPSIAFSKSTTACSAGMQISGQDNNFSGAVVSNSGVDSAASNGGPLLIYNKDVDASCIKLHGGTNWKKIETAAPRDWPVPPPTCTPACTPATANAKGLVTSVDGVPCHDSGDKFSPTTQLAPGLYCATQSINISKTALQSLNVGFVAPTITISGGNSSYTGYTGLLSQYGGLLFYAYDTKINASGSNNNYSGAMFAPFDEVQISGSSSSSIIGFMEGDIVHISGGGGTWQGLGPGFDQTPGTPATTTTTTIPGTTTVTTLPGAVITTTVPGATHTTTTSTTGLDE